MGLTQGDYWSHGSGPPDVELVEELVRQLDRHHAGSRAAKDMNELLAALIRVRHLTSVLEKLSDALADVSMGYGYDLGNNCSGDGPFTARAVHEYERKTGGAS